MNIKKIVCEYLIFKFKIITIESTNNIASTDPCRNSTFYIICYLYYLYKETFKSELICIKFLRYDVGHFMHAVWFHRKALRIKCFASIFREQIHKFQWILDIGNSIKQWLAFLNQFRLDFLHLMRGFFVISRIY